MRMDRLTSSIMFYQLQKDGKCEDLLDEKFDVWARPTCNLLVSSNLVGMLESIRSRLILIFVFFSMLNEERIIILSWRNQ